MIQKTTIGIIIVLFLMTIVSTIGFCMTRVGLEDEIKESMHKEQVIQQYQEYLTNCELLLDSVSGRDSTFMDEMSYTDVFYNYMRSKEKVDSILLSTDF